MIIRKNIAEKFAENMKKALEIYYRQNLVIAQQAGRKNKFNKLKGKND